MFCSCVRFFECEHSRYRDVGIALICFWSTTNRNGRRLCEARNDLHRSCRCSRKQVDASVGTFACIRTPRLCCSVKVRILCRSRNILRRRDRWNGSFQRGTILRGSRIDRWTVVSSSRGCRCWTMTHRNSRPR